MKKIEAIIRKEKFAEVDAALKVLGVGGLTLEEATGRGRARETTTVHARGDWTLEEEYIPRIKLEIVVNDADVQKVVDVIVKNAGTGSIGDGKIVVSTLEQVVDIGTSATGGKAINQ